MTNQSTLDKLIEIHMTPMVDAFRIQKDDRAMEDVPFEDCFGMLVDAEYTARRNNHLRRLIRNAELEQPDASITAIDYGHNRNMYVCGYPRTLLLIDENFNGRILAIRHDAHKEIRGDNFARIRIGDLCRISSPAQSTSICSPGFRSICMVVRRFCPSCRI